MDFVQQFKWNLPISLWMDYNFSDFTKPVSDALGDCQIDKAEIAQRSAIFRLHVG